MTKQDIENAVYEVLISYIADKVAEKMAIQGKEALVVFTGSLMGFDTALENLKKLRSDGFNFHVFLTQSAQSLLDLSKIEKDLQPKEIYQNDKIVPEQLASQFDTVLVPCMTINTMAKIAGCIADTTATRIISNALMRGKNVIIGVDGCCPDNEARAAKGYKMTEALKVQLRENMKKTASYGAYLTTLENLYDNTKIRVLGQGPKGEAKAEVKIPANAESGENTEIRTLSQKVIGSVDILSNSGCRVIKISKNTLVTKLAEEAAQKHKIQLIRE